MSAGMPSRIGSYEVAQGIGQKVAGGVLILERLPVAIEIHNYAHPVIVMPKMVSIEVSPSSRVPDPEHVATLYESAVYAPCALF
jgi:hypothetical protein